MRLHILTSFLLLSALGWSATDTLQSTRPMTPSDSVPVDTRVQDSLRRSGPFEFRAERVDLHGALALFAGANGLRLRTEGVVDGVLSTSFRGKDLDAAMAELLKGSDLEWELVGDLLKVRTKGVQEIRDTVQHANLSVLPAAAGSRIFRIDYPRLKRSGTGSSAARISTTGSGEAGNVNLSTSDELSFWNEIETQVQSILGEGGNLVVNRTGGILYATASPEKLDAVQTFLQAVIPAVTSQVEITARIYEVTIEDDQSLGVDWEAVDHVAVSGMGFVTGFGTFNEQGGASYKAKTFGATFARDQGGISAMVSAMKQQGDVRAVSQPRVTTLSNQPALVKVGTDMPYFSATVTTDATTGDKQVQEQITVVTVGVILSVTPQVGSDGWITMGIDPIVSDLISTITSANGSSAPVIDVKQSSTLVRLRDRETIRISGLLQNKESEVQRKVPLLGDIPFLGVFFRWSYHQKVRKELVVFLTPRIL